MKKILFSLVKSLKNIYKHGTLREKILLSVFLCLLLLFPIIAAIQVVIPFTYIAL